ncbi:hypothetical protein V1508DRAFT_364740 [Lipomyces doorenjongii]|uniref:uncharacterized protein n=1 Tax=Lipomyces doorenjongii TaxID=383834 RepID=UPI0034CF7993
MDEEFTEGVALEEGFVPFPQVEVIVEDLPLESKHKLISRLWREEGARVNTIDDLPSQQDKTRFHELCEACRAGDLEQVDNMVSFGVDVNAIDEFDYTPLILASLCGHEEVVKYLLEHGAVCDRDTFQGERCLYGALTDNIRSLLLKFDISKAVDAIQPFAAHIASLLTKIEPSSSDVIFSSSTKPTSTTCTGAAPAEPRQFHLHRFILAARSTYFRENLAGRWCSKKLVKLSSSMDPRAFDIVVKYIYSVDIAIGSMELNERTSQFARKLDLPDLISTLENLKAEESFRRKREHRQEDMRRAQADFERFVQKDVISARTEVRKDDFLADKERFCAVPVGSTADILLSVEDEDEDMIVLYPTHRAMLIRSEYYMTMFTSSFAEGAYSVSNFEAQDDGAKKLPTVALSASKAVAEIILRYIYTDRVDIPGAIALDVLYCADLLLIDKLKSLASVALTNSSAEDDDAISDPTVGKHATPLYANIYDILRAGWATRMDRLERFAAKYFADNLAHFIVQDDFADIVLESAQRIRSRDETDTIELIDDIRFYLAQKYGILFEDDMDPVTGKVQEGPWRKITNYERQYNAELDLIDGLLERLDLDA